MTEILDSVDACVDRTLAAVGKELVIATPLGLGKPVQLLNAFYRRAESDPSLSLHIVTALCLEVPDPGDKIEAALFNPLRERLFLDYEELAFCAPYRKGNLPSNIKITELYFRAGAMKNQPIAQQNYISSNYTHIGRDMRELGINVFLQMVAARGGDEDLRISLSCNPDITLEMMDFDWPEDKRPMSLAQIHEDLPFMLLDAEVSPASFDVIVRNPTYRKALFAVPNPAVPDRDYATALHASSLIVDGGTLQIGIGALGDALAHACILRHCHNNSYNTLLDAITIVGTGMPRESDSFAQGLYVSTEMFVNGVMQLIDEGIVSRKVYDNLALQKGLNDGSIDGRVNEGLLEYCRKTNLLPRRIDPQSLWAMQHWGIIGERVSLSGEELLIDGQPYHNDLDNPQVRAALLAQVDGTTLKNGRLLHAGFFLGPRDFYERLRNLDDTLAEQICMTGVRRTNQLLLDVPLYTAQRRDARFINTGMIVSLNGAVASDTLEDGTVISGVGGQYNFVAMAHDLPGARSILCIRATRGEGRHVQSNIVPAYGYTTIPRHLRDIVVTEYGVADLRGQSDREVAERLISIADSRFQQDLVDAGIKAGKLPPGYEVPEPARYNTPERLAGHLAPFKEKGLLPAYPFGTELSEQEQSLTASLRAIKSLSEEPKHFVANTVRALFHKADPDAARPFLERLQLEHPGTTREFLVQQLLLLELEERGLLKAG